MDKTQLSIIIITYNNCSTIYKCLSSINRTPEPSEIVLIDNYSKDGTKEEIIRFQSRYHVHPLTIHWNDRNIGFARAVNQGFKLSSGSVIVLLGSDTEVYPNTFKILKDALDQNRNAGIVAPQLLTPDNQIQNSCRNFPLYKDIFLELTGLPRIAPAFFRPVWKLPWFNHAVKSKVEQPEATCLMTRMEYIKQVGSMDERFVMFFNDVDWCRRFKSAGLDILFFPEAKVKHWKGYSVHSAFFSMIWKSHQGCYRYFQKYASSGRDRVLNQILGFLLIFTAALRSSFFYFFGRTRLSF